MYEDIEVLLIEDNPGDIELTLHELRTHHLANRVYVARDGEEAMPYLFGNRHPQTDSRLKLVLLGTRLPKVSGLEVLRRIRDNESTNMTPIVVLTSSQEDQDTIQASGLWVNAYVRKPVSFDSFCEVVRKIGRHWLVVTEPGLVQA